MLSRREKMEPLHAPLWTGLARSVVILLAVMGPTSAPAKAPPSFRFIEAIKEEGAQPLFRDPLQMSLQEEAAEVAVSNNGIGNAVIFDLKRRRPLLKIGGKKSGFIPYGLLLKKDGSIVVGGLKSGLIKVFGARGETLKILDLAKLTGHPVRPGRIRAGRGDRLLVVDRLNDDVLSVSKDGAAVTTFSRPGEMERVQDAVVGPDGKVYVLTNGKTAVYVFGKDGAFSYSFGKHGGEHYFSFPCALAFDSQKRLWVVDAFQHRLKVFSAAGKFLFQVGSIGWGPTNLFFPIDLAFGEGGKIYVLDKGTNQIKIFSVGDLKK